MEVHGGTWWHGLDLSLGMTWYGTNVASMWQMDDVASCGIWWGGIDVTPTWPSVDVAWVGMQGVGLGKGVRVHDLVGV
jgi:hypothetical protein